MNQKQRMIVESHFLSIDPSFADVIAIAKDTHVYHYADGWVDNNIVGTLYLCKYAAPLPRKIVIMNKKSTENFETIVDSRIAVERHEQFVIISSAKTHVGLWFNSKSNAIDICSRLKNEESCSE